MGIKRIVYLLLTVCLARPIHVPMVGVLVVNENVEWSDWAQSLLGAFTGAAANSVGNLNELGCASEITAIAEYAYMIYIYIREYVTNIDQNMNDVL